MKEVQAEQTSRAIDLGNKTFEELEATLIEIDERARNNELSTSDLNELGILLGNKDRQVRDYSVVAIRWAAEYDQDEAKFETIFGLLVSALGEKETRSDALEGLSFYDHPELLYRYGGMLLQDKDELVRVQAAENLADIDDPAVIPFFNQALEDKTILVRLFAIQGLGLSGAIESVPKLIDIQKRARKMTIKAQCWGALLLLTGESVWLDKIISVLDHADYYVPCRAICSMDDAISREVIFPEQVVSHVEKYLETEDRRAVTSRFEEFLRDHSPEHDEKQDMTDHPIA